jgi:hypothetical protein
MFDDQKTRVVLLNHSFGGDGRDMKELRVRFTEQGAMFFHLAQDAEPKSYGISAAEADAFCEQWLEYRKKQKVDAQAVQDRLSAIIDEAIAIVEQCPAIKIEQYDNWYRKDEPAWKVSVPEIAWRHVNPVGEPTVFLDLVKGARDAYQNHLNLMAESKATA